MIFTARALPVRLLFVAAVLIAGCTAPTQQPATATPVAVASIPQVTAALPATPVPTWPPAAEPNQGGVTAGEPALLGSQPPVAATATAPATPAATATPIATATRTPAPPTPTVTRVPPATIPVAAAPAAPATATPAAPFVPSTAPHPLQIAVMRQQAYPGSELTFEQTLEPGVNYRRFVVSYKSEGLKIYALLTVPNGPKPASGWPVILFNHGYIPPAQYRTTERYVAYVDGFARNGYIVLKSDYRGHGSSEGSTSGGGYGSPAYTADVLNALGSLKRLPDVDPNRVGMWGHSMGGQVTLRAMVVSKEIKAGVIWGGVVGPYPDTFVRANLPTRVPRPGPTPTPSTRFSGSRNWRNEMTLLYGTVQQNPQFYASISPNSYLNELSGPIQLHHSVTDEEVPVQASQALFEQAKKIGAPVELFTYPGDNHNISGNFSVAIQRSIAFFDKHVKNVGGK